MRGLGGHGNGRRCGPVPVMARRRRGGPGGTLRERASLIGTQGLPWVPGIAEREGGHCDRGQAQDGEGGLAHGGLRAALRLSGWGRGALSTGVRDLIAGCRSKDEGVKPGFRPASRGSGALPGAGPLVVCKALGKRRGKWACHTRTWVRVALVADRRGCLYAPGWIAAFEFCCALSARCWPSPPGRRLAIHVSNRNRPSCAYSLH